MKTENPFSQLYDYVAEMTGLPRSLVKSAIIGQFCGVPGPNHTWDAIVEAFQATVGEHR